MTVLEDFGVGDPIPMNVHLFLEVEAPIQHDGPIELENKTDLLTSSYIIASIAH